MKDAFDLPQPAALRAPSHVMRLAQMGQMFPTRLSFLRVLLRRLGSEGAKLTRPIWAIDARGFGHAVYSIDLGGFSYSLVAISTDLPPEKRTDRVIAEAWDTAYVLYDGVPSSDEIARIVATAPKQEAARFTERDLILSRANKSVRLWARFVEGLRQGHMPSLAEVNAVGYLMRTTAVYGNGKFGIADRHLFADRPGATGSFSLEMLTVWMIRNFTHDLLEHEAGAPLPREIKRHLGIGNATGLGMAPFLVSHPVLLNNWMMARETALSRVRSGDGLPDSKRLHIERLTRRVERHLEHWSTPDQVAQEEIEDLRGHWPTFVEQYLSQDALAKPHALNAALDAAKAKGAGLEELVVALSLEVSGDEIDDLADGMHDASAPLAVPFGDTADLAHAIPEHCSWALGIDYAAKSNCAQFWYVSEEKLEPRLGQRFDEPRADLESPLDIARRISALYADLPNQAEPLSEFLLSHPDHLLAVMAVNTAARYPYALIQDNLIAATCRPVDLLRAKLAMFGAAKFDPKSNLWTRITLCQGAPLPDELTPEACDDWWLAAPDTLQ
ncbi:MAG: hypothetical protein MK098_14790 [Marinovum sp.]|nr:hypothetical protein [Marinovum sp.]